MGTGQIASMSRGDFIDHQLLGTYLTAVIGERVRDVKNESIVIKKRLSRLSVIIYHQLKVGICPLILNFVDCKEIRFILIPIRKKFRIKSASHNQTIKNE